MTDLRPRTCCATCRRTIVANRWGSLLCDRCALTPAERREVILERIREAASRRPIPYSRSPTP